MNLCRRAHLNDPLIPLSPGSAERDLVAVVCLVEDDGHRQPPVSKVGPGHDHRYPLPNMKLAGVWREYGLQPWRTEMVKFSTDPQLDEKAQIQALDRPAPILPPRPGWRASPLGRAGLAGSVAGSWGEVIGAA